MVGHVVEPAADAVTGPRPLVLFLHGRHGSATTRPPRPVVRQLAVRGAVQGDPEPARLRLHPAGARVAGLRHGLGPRQRHQRAGLPPRRRRRRRPGARSCSATSTTGPASRPRTRSTSTGSCSSGTAAAARGSTGPRSRSPCSAPYRIVGQVLIAPTDFGTQTAPYVPTVTLLPFCDGDVSDLQGQRFTDTARDLTGDDTSLKSSVLVMGANHNFFNTEWTPGIAQAPASDDWYGGAESACGTEEPAPAERRPSSSRSARRTSPGRSGSSRAASRTSCRSSTAPGPGWPRPATRRCSATRSAAAATCVPRGPAPGSPCPTAPRPASARASSSVENLVLRPGHELRAGEAALARRLRGRADPLVLRDVLDRGRPVRRAGPRRPARPERGRRLELRTIVDAGRPDADLRVRITDADGADALLTPPVAASSLPSGWARRGPQVLGPDPRRRPVRRCRRPDPVVRRRPGRAERRRSGLGRRPRLPRRPPSRRSPTCGCRRSTLPKLRIDEGDGHRTVTAHLPFEITGDLTRPARFTVVTVRATARPGRALRGRPGSGADVRDHPDRVRPGCP